MERICANPLCNIPITTSMGGCKASDFLSVLSGKLDTDIRELCGLCAMFCRWDEEDRLLMDVLRIKYYFNIALKHHQQQELGLAVALQDCASDEKNYRMKCVALELRVKELEDQLI